MVLDYLHHCNYMDLLIEIAQALHEVLQEIVLQEKQIDTNDNSMSEVLFFVAQTCTLSPGAA